MEKLASGDRTVFEKIFDEVKYLCKVVTADSKEARQLEKVKKTFEDAYRKAQKSPTGDGGVRYSLSDGTTKDASELSKSDLQYLLESAQNGELSDNSYIPLRRNTPEFFIEVIKEHSKGSVVIENYPMAATVEHLRQNMEEEDGQSYGDARPHGFSTDDIITMSEKMGDPSYIVLQKNGRYAEVVSFYNGKNKQVVVAIDLADSSSAKPKNYKYTQYMNGYGGGYYNIIVTQYEPDSLAKYLNDCEVIYSKKEMNGRYQVGSGRVVTVTHDTPFIKDSIRNPDKKVNTKSSLSANGVAERGSGWQIMGEDVARKDVPSLDQLAEEMAAQRKRERKGSAELSAPLYLDNGMAWHYIENGSDLLTDEIRILEVTFMAQTVEQLRKGIAESDAKRDAGLTTPEDIQRFDDLCYGDDPQWNTLDVYRPKGEEGLLPVIISIHGGGWVYGDKELYSHYCIRLAQRGFAVVNFSYRLAPENKYPAALEDICKVCHWVMAHGAEYQMDLGNIFMLGDSAGGQLCHQILTILTNPRYASMFDFEMPSGFRVNACALNCGCYFVPLSRLTPPQGMTKMYLPEDYMSVAKQMKVIDYTTKDFPPAMVMSARYDFLKFMAAPMYRKLKRRGVPCRLQIYGKRGEKHIGHVFHLDCRSDLAAKCNDDQCAFFREYLR